MEGGSILIASKVVNVNLSELNEIINPIEKARDAIKTLSLCNGLVNQPDHEGFKARLDAVCTELQELAADAVGLTTK